MNKQRAQIISQSEKCHIRKKRLKTSRDNFHYTGKYKGVAYNICNSKYSLPEETPAVFHNGSNYDNFFIIKELTV